MNMLVTYIRSALALKMDKRAVTAIEYALIAALIAVVIIAAVTALGSGSSENAKSLRYCPVASAPPGNSYITEILYFSGLWMHYEARQEV
jgi:pilus assembly protein Flp/PilA